MTSLADLANISTKTEKISITATIDTALCVGAGGSSGSLADKPIVRTADSKLLIPASHLKGRLRHECEKLARGLGWKVCESPLAQTMCPQHAGLDNQEEFDRTSQYEVEGDDRHHCIICQLFGNPALPSRLLFRDLICTESPDNLPSEVLRPGVTINRRRRTAEKKKLYFLETSPANVGLKFEGQIVILNAENTPIFNDINLTKAFIWAGLKQIKALGGSKSTGLGWLKFEKIDLDTDRIDWDKLIPPASLKEDSKASSNT